MGGVFGSITATVSPCLMPCSSSALASWRQRVNSSFQLRLLAVTSPDLLHRGWTAAQAARWSGESAA